MNKEKQLVGIVNKPQFDTDVFKVGKAVKIEHYYNNSSTKEYVKHALITMVAPLEIKVAFLVKSRNERNYKEDIIQESTISIDDLINGTDVIIFLKEPTEKPTSINFD